MVRRPNHSRNPTCSSLRTTRSLYLTGESLHLVLIKHRATWLISFQVRSSSNPPHAFACTTPLGVRGSPSICYQSRLCAVLSPRRVQDIFPPQYLTSLGPVGSCHVMNSQACRILLMISSTIHQDAGCKSYACCSLAYMSNP